MNTIKLIKISSLFTLLLLFGCSKPMADFAYNGKKHVAPTKVTFENKSKKAETYEWDFGDGTTSSEAMPSHRYTSSGNYTVVLKATKGGKSNTKKKKIVVDAPVQCLVEVETNYGNMTILLSNETPLHRDNFIKLVEEGFYDDLLFHRVINGFMIQGGDPESKNAGPKKRLGSGGPGYLIPAEFSDSLVHIKGALAAARTNNPEKKSSGSQFYIVHGKKMNEAQLKMVEAQKDMTYTPAQRKAYLELGGTPHLDKGYTVFGMVIEGLDVVDKIAGAKTLPGDRPAVDVKMKMKAIK